MLDRKAGVEALIKAASYLPPDQLADLRRACEFCERAHAGVVREAGEPYFYHPLIVAHTLAGPKLQLDVITLIAALLHDVIEDNPRISPAVVEREFGGTVLAVVQGVSKVSREERQDPAERNAESLRKLLLAMSQDLRVILIKLADRLHNLKTLEAKSPEARKRIARETLDIYIPIARRLGIYYLRAELEDQAFLHYDREAYTSTRRLMKTIARSEASLRKTIQDRLMTHLKRDGLETQIEDAPETAWSMYQRAGSMQPLDDYVPLRFNLTLASVSDCYRALAVVHHLFRPRTGQFLDQIAFTAGTEQGLLTHCTGPRPHTLQIRLRTSAMRELAELGLVAHWQKHRGEHGGSAEMSQRLLNQWLGLVLDVRGTPALDLVEALKAELVSEEIRVLTTAGDMVRLPVGSTPIDLAYAIDSYTGDHFSYALVDGRKQSAGYRLAQGQRVELITSEATGPTPEWIDCVCTARARQMVLNQLGAQPPERAEAMGLTTLEHALERRGYAAPPDVSTAGARVARTFRLPSGSELLRAIGRGQLAAAQVAARWPVGKAYESTSPVAMTISAGASALTRFAECCGPIHGDRVIGELEGGKVVIHRAQCKQVAALQGIRARLVGITWPEGGVGELETGLRLSARDAVKALSSALQAVSEAGVGYTRSNIVTEVAGNLQQAQLYLKVSGHRQLAQVIAAIRKNKDIQRIRRIPR